MEHEEYLTIQNQLQDYFDGRYKSIIDCERTVNDETYKIDELKNDFFQFREESRVDRAKISTRLSILIAILSAIAVPIVSVCIKMIFGD